MRLTRSCTEGRKFRHETSTHGAFAFVTMMTLPSAMAVVRTLRTASWRRRSGSNQRGFAGGGRENWSAGRLARIQFEGHSVSSQSKIMIVWSGLKYSACEPDDWRDGGARCR